MTIFTNERIASDLSTFCGNLLFPNDILPADMQDGRTDYVSGETLIAKCNERDRLESDHEAEKREKARRVELYRSQLENSQEEIFLTGRFEFDYLPKK